jgi:hypothetical protein
MSSSNSTVLVFDTPDREDLEIQRLKRQIQEFQDRLEEVETRKRQRTAGASTLAIASPPSATPPLATHLPSPPSPPPTIIPDDDAESDDDDDDEVEVIKSYISVGQFVNAFIRPSNQETNRLVGQVTSALYRGKYCRDKSFTSVYNRYAQLSKPMRKTPSDSNAYEDIDTHLIEKAFHLVVERDMTLNEVLSYFRKQGWGFLQQVVGRSCTMDIFKALLENQ